MLMVVLERVKELGMLMAVGMSKTKVFTMITLETIFLSLTGGITGMAMSEAVVSVFHRRGLDFSMFSEGFEAYGFPSMIFPEVKPEYYIILTLLVIFTAVASSIYPALKALRLDPADALRTE
jgi:ABC-type antimicrobial peptide transport system permease subunit